jgi:hypothetical protein
MSDQIPPQVETFVSECIGSIAELELLLLLAEDPSRPWTIDAAARQLYVTPASVDAVFVRMASKGLLSQGADGYRFSPPTPEAAETIRALKELYATRRLKVMEMIYAGPTDKYQSFADAFRLRKNQ